MSDPGIRKYSTLFISLCGWMWLSSNFESVNGGWSEFLRLLSFCFFPAFSSNWFAFFLVSFLFAFIVLALFSFVTQVIGSFPFAFFYSLLSPPSNAVCVTMPKFSLFNWFNAYSAVSFRDSSCFPAHSLRCLYIFVRSSSFFHGVCRPDCRTSSLLYLLASNWIYDCEFDRECVCDCDVDHSSQCSGAGIEIILFILCFVQLVGFVALLRFSHSHHFPALHSWSDAFLAATHD